MSRFARVIKHRQEEKPIAFDFAGIVDADATLSSPELTIIRTADGEDVTDEFLEGAPAWAIDGLVVVREWQAAADGKQLVGDYRCQCGVDVSTGETPRIWYDANGNMPVVRVIDT